jgi:hypothetical protein
MLKILKRSLLKLLKKNNRIVRLSEVKALYTKQAFDFAQDDIAQRDEIFIEIYNHITIEPIEVKYNYKILRSDGA